MVHVAAATGPDDHDDEHDEHDEHDEPSWWHRSHPTFAGVAFSNNEFRWSARIKRDDGLVRMVPGLGTRAVDRVGDDYPVLCFYPMSKRRDGDANWFTLPFERRSELMHEHGASGRKKLSA